MCINCLIFLGPYDFLHDITCGRNNKSQQQVQLSRKCQFRTVSGQSSSIFFTTATTFANNTNFIPEYSYFSSPRRVNSKYRQALIARFWSTMRSIVQTDSLIKHLETYSPSTGHLIDCDISNQSRQQNENPDGQIYQKPEGQLVLENQQILKSQQMQQTSQTPWVEQISLIQQTSLVQKTPQIQQINDSSQISSNENNNILNMDITQSNTGTKEAKSVNFTGSGVPNRSPLRSGMPLFYQLPTNSNTSFSLKQNQVKLK